MCPHTRRSGPMGLETAFSCHDSLLRGRCRTQIPLGGLQFDRGGIMVLEWAGGGVGRSSYGKCRLNQLLLWSVSALTGPGPGVIMPPTAPGGIRESPKPSEWAKGMLQVMSRANGKGQASVERPPSPPDQPRTPTWNQISYPFTARSYLGQKSL